MSDLERDIPSNLDETLTGFLDDIDAEGQIPDLQECLESWGGSLRDSGTMLGDFELLQPLGRGGMGVVWKAVWKSANDVEVAVKILSRFTSRGVDRFRREIRAIGNLEHDGIVRVVASGVQDGVPYFAMELVSGLALDRLVNHLARTPHPPQGTREVRDIVRWLSHGGADGLEPDAHSWEESYDDWVARIGALLAEAVQHAHDRGIVHRDLKPANIVITREGRPVLLDFGLASLEGEVALTADGEFFGSLAYASPEQVRGGGVGPRGDVYALGATLYELLTLRRPFYGATRSELQKRVLEDEPAPFEGTVPADLQTVCLKALSKSPRARYATAEALGRDLRAYLERKPIEARPPGIGHMARRWVRRHPLVGVAVLAVVVSLAGARTVDHVRAATRVREGLSVLEEYAAAGRQRCERQLELQELLAVRRVGEAIDLRYVDELRDRIRAATLELELSARESESWLREASYYVAGHAGARGVLARLYAEELRQALWNLDDIYDPARVERIEQSVRAFAEDDVHDAWLDTRGSARLASEPHGASIRVHAETGELVASGTSPLLLAGREQGSYIASFELTGFAPTRLPFRIRRDACYLEEGALPEQARVVKMLPREQLPEGFVYVPAGWTLVEDDPRHWEWVEGFQIQQYEVTYRQYLEWLQLLIDSEPSRLSRAEWVRMVDPAKPEYKPRYSNEAGDLHVNPDPATGGFVIGEEASPSWPVRGLSMMEMDNFSSCVGLLLWPSKRGFTSLPTSAEWIRASRGEDGRTYPWGRGFSVEHCAAYGSEASYGTDPSPFPVGQFEADVSPLGVRDMAGSVSEATRDLAGQIPGVYRACGGSYRRWKPDDFAITAVHESANEPRPDVGFRMVRRDLGEWFREDGPYEAFEDTFDRPGVDSGWLESFDEPFGIRTNPHQVERVSIRDGQLICRGASGDWSEASSAWRRIHVPDAEYSVRVTVQAAPETILAGPHAKVVLEEDCLPGVTRAFSAMISTDGTLALDATGRSDGSLEASCGLDCHESNVLELRAVDGRMEARAWALGEARPAEPIATLELQAEWRPRWLVLACPKGSAIVRYDDVSVELTD